MLNHGLSRLLTSTATIAVIAFAAPVFGQSPQAPVISAGSIAVSRQGATTVVTQSTEKGAIDWRSFSVGPQETVRFDQPGRSSITLNRVTGSEMSRIDGSILSNGQVWLSNPNGVLIGPSGQVNVGSLLATTGRIDAAEFLRSGRAQIDQIGRDAAIVNGGTISVAVGGYAALAAASIRNEGVVAARAGTVAFGAGKAITVDFTGDRLIQFQVTQPLDQAPAGADAAIVNSGAIAAQGGTVLLSARAAKGVMDNVINLKGHVIANGVTVDGGTVFFGDGGTVQVSAKIDASDATGQGGAVSVLGEKVGLMDGASIDASGATGGGVVLVGGEWQGGGTLGAQGRNAQIAYVAPTASINVDATMAGNGGEAVVWADDTARFNGSISARGGALSGDGGRVETSGKKTLQVGAAANVTTLARTSAGKAGAWLLDPTDISIVATGGVESLSGGSFTASGASTSIDVGVINTALATTSVTLQTTSGGGGNGDIIFVGGTISTSGGTARTLSLLADRDIILQSSSEISFTGAAHNIVLNSRASNSVAGSIIIGTSTLISTTGGSISLVGGTSGAGAATGGGTNASGVALQGVINSNGGNIVIRGQGGANGLGVALSGSTASITGGVGTVSITGTGGSSGGASLYGVSVSGGANVSTTNGAIIVSGTAVSASNFANGVNVDNATINASGTGAVSLTGVRGAGNTSRNILIINSATVQTSSGSLTLTGTSSAGGTTFSNGGVRVDNALVTTATGAISISGTGAAVNNTSQNGIEVLNGGKVTATGSTGSITMTGVRGTGSSSSSNIFIGSAGATTISTIGGNITIDASAAADNIGIDNVGFNMTAGARITTAGGTISITGAIGGDGTGGAQPGVSVQGGSIIDATGSGAVIVTGVRGPAAGSRNILISGSGSTIATSSGALTLNGTATNGGASSLNHGVELTGATLSTAGGAITVNGTGGATGVQNYGIVLGSTSSLITTTGSGGTVQLKTQGAASGASGGDIVFTGGTISFSAANTLSTVTLLAEHDIDLQASSAITVANGSLNVTLNSGATGSAGSIVGAIRLDQANVTTNGGFIKLVGGAGGTTLARGDGSDSSRLVAGASVQGSVLDTTKNGAAAAGVTGDITIWGEASPNYNASGGGGAYIVNDGFNGVGTVGSTVTSIGAIDIKGFGGQMSTDNSTGLVIGNFNVSATATVVKTTGSSTNLNAITLLGQRGSGGTATNIAILRGTLMTAGGNMTLNAGYAGGAGPDSPGFRLENGAVSTASGTISINGLGGPTGAGNTGVLITNSSSVNATATGGQIVISGTASTASSTAISFSNATLSTVNTPLIVEGDSLLSTSSTFTTGAGGKTVLRPITTSLDINLAAASSAGTLGLTGVANQVTGLLEIGRSDLSGKIVSGAMTLTQDLSLLTGGGAISIGGLVNATTSGGQYLKLNAGAGTISLGGGIGAGVALSALDLSGGVITTVTGGGPGFITTGTQSYVGAVRLIGDGSSTTATFATTDSDIRFSNTIDSSATGAEQALFFSTGTGKVSLAGAVGNTTPMRSINSSGSGSLTVNGLVRSSQSQSYAGAVIAASASTFRTASANVIFGGAVNGPGALTVDTSSGAATVAFAGQVGFTTALGSLTRGGGASAATYFTNAVNTVKTAGTQSYAGPVIFANSAVNLSTTDSVVTFSQAVDSLDTLTNIGGLTISAGTGTVSFGNNAGVGTALTSLASTGTGVVRLGGTFRTTGTQSYAGLLFFPGATTTTLSASNATILGGGGGSGNFIVAGPATIAGTINGSGAHSYGGTLLVTGASMFRAGTSLTFAGAIDAQSAGIAVTATVTGVGGVLSFAGPVGSTTPLGAVQIYTNNAALNLPAFKSSSAVINTNGGTLGQAGAITLTSVAIIDTGGGAINLDSQANDFTSLNVTTGAGSAAFRDAVGAMSLSSINVGGTLSITGNSGSVINQSSPMTVGELLLLGSGAIYQLTNAGNSVGTLAASTGTGGIQVVSTSGMSTGNIAGTNGVTTTGTLRLSVTNGANLLVNAPVSGGATFLTAAGTISGTSAVTASALTVSASGGSLNNVVVNGQTAAAAAALVSITGGIVINGVPLGTATVASTASVASTPSVASSPTVATTASVASMATIPSIASIAPTASTVSSVASIATVATAPTLPLVATTPILSLILSREIPSLLLRILPVIPPVNFGLLLNDPAGSRSPQPSGVSAADIFGSVTNAPPGAFIPMTPPSVQGTGAPLASSQTIKVDPIDAGGANGQVIAVAVGGGGGSTVILPGLLIERRIGAARNGIGSEPPLAQQPSQMNEEPMLD